MAKLGKAKVKINGHQFFTEFDAEILSCGTAIEMYRNEYKEVPGLIALVGEKIEVIPLQKELYEVEVTMLSGESTEKDD